MKLLSQRAECSRMRLAALLSIWVVACGSSGTVGRADAGPGSGGGASGVANGGSSGGGAAGQAVGGGTPGGGAAGQTTNGGATGGPGGATGQGNGGTAPGGGSVDGSAPAVTSCFGIPLPPRALSFSSKTPASLTPYSLTTALKTATPGDAGFDSAKLDTATSFATPHSHTQGILVLRGGYVIAEHYIAPFTADTRHESYSMAKSFTSGLVGIAIDQKLFADVHTPLCTFYPASWKCGDPSDAHGRITIEHSMNIETGLAWHEDWRSNATGTNDVYAAGANMLDYVLARPIADEPGTKQRYSTGDPALLSGAIQGVAGKTAYDFGKSVLFDSIGISGVQWNADPKGRTTTYAGLQATAREYAKYGFLYSRRGMWDGKQVVPASWVDFTTEVKDRCAERYRYLWHVNPPLRLGAVDPACPDFPNCKPSTLADLPSDGFFAEGIYGQYIFVFPSADLVVVRLAQDDLGLDYWDAWAAGFLSALFAALK